MHGAEIRILPSDVQITIGLVDDNEVCIRIDNNSLDSDVVWSNNPALVNIFRTYFNELWAKAKKLKLTS
jgi:sugar-specific transcriptional regulator TrmB